MNENNQIKRTRKSTIVLIIVIVILVIAMFQILPILLIKNITNKVRNEMTESTPNAKIENFSVYVPHTWKSNNKYFISPSLNCRVTGGTTLYSQERVELGFAGEELEHEQITINNIDISYGYKQIRDEKIYSYYFIDNNTKYFVLFRNNIESDQECNEYIGQLEKSITLERNQIDEK